MMPLLVVIIAVPRPPLTSGIWSKEKYFLSPGLLALLNSLITGASSKYFKITLISSLGFSPITSTCFIYPLDSKTLQIPSLILDELKRTSLWPLDWAFLTLEIISEIGSCILIIIYQLDLTNPGISPFIASSLNLFLERPNFLYTA